MTRLELHPLYWDDVAQKLKDIIDGYTDGEETADIVEVLQVDLILIQKILKTDLVNNDTIALTISEETVEEIIIHLLEYLE